MKFSICVLISLLFLVLAGCDSSGPAILQISGHYEGTLITHLNGTYQQTSVRSDIAVSGTTPVFVVTDVSGQNQVNLKFQDLTDTTLTLQSSLVMTRAMILTLGSEQGCYVGKSDIQVTLCASNPEISFEIDDSSGNSVLSLVLYHFTTVTPGSDQTETPQNFTLTQAIDRARAMSFQSRIEFEHVVQAKALSRAAYLHLLPQITLGTIANNLAPSFSSILGAIGDLAPFLLPDRWFQADEAAKQSIAEQDADKLMRLDMGAEVEGLFYAYDRDVRSLDVYVTTSLKFTKIRDDVKAREASGQLAMGSTDNVEAVLSALEHGADIFKQVLAEDKSAISASLGFFSPLAVSDAKIDNEIFPIDNAPSVDYNTVNTAAISRSFELDQMDYLILAAQDQKTSTLFSWLDPYGDPNLGLGAALPSEIEVSGSQIKELGIVRDQLKSTISQKAFDAVTDYKQALDNYADSSDDMILHIRRLNEITTELDAGQKIDIGLLMDIMDDYLAEQLEGEGARADYRVARSEIDRLLLQGYYAKF